MISRDWLTIRCITFFLDTETRCQILMATGISVDFQTLHSLILLERVEISLAVLCGFTQWFTL